jgi:putative NADH-flavin reductase
LARVLIVGCGCRGGELAAELLRRGHQVRGTTRDPGATARIEATGAEAVVADPDRLGTLLPALEEVGVVCWLMAAALGAPQLNAERLQALVEKLVDTPVRAFVYEARGSVEADLLERGAEVTRAVGERYRMPVAVLEHDPADHSGWVDAAAAAVEASLVT